MNKQFEVQETEKFLVFSTPESRIVVRKTEEGLELREVKVKTGGVEVYYVPNRLYIVTPAETLKFKTEGYVYADWEDIVSMLDDALKAYEVLDQIALMSPDERETVKRKIEEYGLYMDEEEEEEPEEKEE
jgi:hypothetical protein